jgi:segregation and condensation protein B
MEISQIIPHIEALIFASDKALTLEEITELINNALGFIEDRADIQQVEAAIEGIREKYNAEFYAFELKQSGGGWQFLTKPMYHKTVALLNGDKFLKRLSAAALETLAIIAYKQPITKSEIESIRGVNCDYAVQKLLEKDLIIISGRNEDAVGKPLIYGTSKSFMDYFGINSANELPKINEVLMEELVKSTLVNPEATQSEENAPQEATEELNDDNSIPEA